MIFEQETVASGDISFDDMLDETCERLWDTKVRYSLKRIGELEAGLRELERELDNLVPSGPLDVPA